MTGFLTPLVRKWRYGEEIVTVSGLPRSGTSMLMSMLQAGGLPILSDHVREADEDNLRGYFEYERVKDLEKHKDKSWVRLARGKAVKVISHLLKALPDDNFYRVILSERDLAEVIASQNLMLQRRGEHNPVHDDKAVDLYRKHLLNVKLLCKSKPNFDLLEVSYYDALNDPRACAVLITDFLGARLDPR